MLEMNMTLLYIGTKTIKALPMTRLAYNQYRGWELPADEIGEDEGFLVEYVDGGKANHPNHEGYVSWSPADVFHRAYQSTDAMNFGHALELLKVGMPIQRAGWNGKGMFVYLVPAASYPAQTGVAKAYFGDEALVPYAAYMALKGADGTVSTWVPSINDVLAEDWSTFS
jgi:hypothetical protein